MILVVDDDHDVRETLVTVLQMQGFSAAGARDGAEALERMRGDEVSLVLLDLMMPVMSGFRFREEQLKDPRLAEVPVVAMSADWNALNAFDGPVRLRKPIELEALEGAVGTCAPAP